MRPFPEPDFAYIPGQTPRHPERTFDDLRQTARAGMSASDLLQCDAWKAGLHFLETGFYWEAHEVIEPVWLALPAGPERQLARAVIQLANAELKQKMRRGNAVARLCAIAEDLLREVPLEVVRGAGVSPEALKGRLSALRKAANLSGLGKKFAI